MSEERNANQHFLVTRDFLERIELISKKRSESDSDYQFQSPISILETNGIDAERINEIMRGAFGDAKSVFLSSDEVTKVSAHLGVDSFVFFSSDSSEESKNQCFPYRYLIAQRVIARRRSLKLSTSDLSKISGVSRSTLINIESGRSDYQLDKLLSIVYSLGSTPYEIIGFPDDLLFLDQLKDLIERDHNALLEKLAAFGDLDSDDSDTMQKIKSFVSESRDKTPVQIQQGIEKIIKDSAEEDSPLGSIVAAGVGVATIAGGIAFASVVVPTVAPVLGGLTLLPIIKSLLRSSD